MVNVGLATKKKSAFIGLFSLLNRVAADKQQSAADRVTVDCGRSAGARNGHLKFHSSQANSLKNG